ncbi:MAG: hypothetical protein H0W00_02905 [Chloroflexi bacterium]|nr:hypothetical protein [Chloroflexota bacterium]
MPLAVIRWATSGLATFVVGIVLGASTALAAAPTTEISSAGPLTRIIISAELNCQVAHEDDTLFEFFPPSSETGACGTFLAVGEVLYGPSQIPSGGGLGNLTPWTPRNQGDVTGTGSGSDPFALLTEVEAAGAGLIVQETNSYVVGSESYRTDVRIQNQGNAPVTGTLYRAGDCFLQGSDVGFGRIDGGAPACVIGREADDRIEQWRPLTPGSRHFEGGFGELWSIIGSRQPLPDRCACELQLDNGAGLSWQVAVPVGGSVVVSHVTLFSPEGLEPTESLPDSVPGPADISLDPLVVAQSAAIAAAVVALIPFPAALFNSTLEKHYVEVMTGVARLRRAVARLRARMALMAAALLQGMRAQLDQRRGVTPSAVPLPAQPPPSMSAAGLIDPPDKSESDVWTTPMGIAAFVLISSLLYLLLDPTLGLELAALATFLGLALGLVVILLAYGVPVWLLARTQGIAMTVRALPATLAVGLACVVISRVADFQPGYLYGLVVGFIFARQMPAVDEGRTQAAATAAALGVALVAWLVLPIARGTGATGGASDAFVQTIAETACVTVIIAGLEAAVFAMLPMRFLPGEKVMLWDRRVWAALLGIGVLGFLHILIGPSSGYLADTTRSSFLTVVGLLIAFGLASVAFWAWFRFRPEPPSLPAS